MRRLALAVTLSLSLAACTCGHPTEAPPTPDTTPPEWPADALAVLTDTTATSATLSWPEATDDVGVVAYRLEASDLAPQDIAETTYLFESLIPGQHLRVGIRALDAAGNASTPLFAEVAPVPKETVPDGDVSADFCAANQFLVKGQAIPCANFSVVTGRVLSSEGAGVPALRVSLLGREEFGAALTRTDGTFALAVPAGSWTLDIRAQAFLPAQRWVTAQPGDYTPLEHDVAVLRRDEAMTRLSTSAGGFHRSTPRKDKDGSRQVALYLPPGTGAALYFSDGGTTPTDTVSLRVTEATVGSLGPEAMPASLPAASAYTFAADFSADEAVAAGADGVRFNGPVAFYVDNFLQFPVGTPVPQGTYDSRAGKWEAQADSLVVQVLEGGQLDSDGDGNADTLTALLPGEAEALAREFPPGTQVWRGTTTHFSTVDCNGGWMCVGTCAPPKLPNFPTDEPHCNGQCGSLILAQNQTVSEFASISGTGMKLAWHSHRTGKRRFHVELLAGDTVDGGAAPDALATRFSFDVAGQHYVQESPDAGHGATATFTWDGKDASGRTVRGPILAAVSVGYSYKVVYVSGGYYLDLTKPTFATWPSPSATAYVEAARDSVYFNSRRTVKLGDWQPRENLGGLSLDVLHGYSATTGVLFRGDGTQADVQATGASLAYLAGGGTDATENAGFKSATLGGINTTLAEGPDGTVYFTEGGRRVRALKPDGGVATVAGQTTWGFAGDGQTGPSARFNEVSALAADEAGNLFVVDSLNFRIRRVDKVTGIVSTVAGNGQRGFSPDGTAALDAKLDGLDDVLVGRDGALYFGCGSASTGKLVRRLRDGRLETVAGGASDTSKLEGPSPLGVYLANQPYRLAEGPDGSLYLGGEARGGFTLRRVSPDGRVTVVAGGGNSSEPSPSLATDTRLSGVTGLAVDAAGTLYVGEDGRVGASGVRGAGVRVVMADGHFGTAAGTTAFAASFDAPPDGAAQAIPLYGVGDVLRLRSGKLLFVHRGQQLTLHTLSSPSGRLSLGERVVPSEDGTELYTFDAEGRHLRTTDAVTRRRLWTFGWGEAGLSSVTDADGDVTRVTRDATGRATSLTAQDGQVTKLTLDAEGRAVGLTDSEGRLTGLAYAPSGLLSSWTDANGNASTFEYDADGRLVSDTNARGAKKTLARSGVENGASVTFTDADGRATVYTSETNFFDGRRLTALLPDGTKEVRMYDGPVRRKVSPDGTEETATLLADGRFGLASEVPARLAVKTPSGLESVTALTRAVATAPTDILDVRTWRDEATVNSHTWVQAFDAASRTVTTTSPLGRATSVLFDASWRPVELRAPGVSPVTVTYDARGRVASTTQGARSGSFTYGSNGMLASVTNSLGEVTQLSTDSAGWPLSTTRADAKTVGFGYDGVGNLTSLTPPEKPAHGFAYSKANEVTQYAPPALPGVGNEGMTYSLQGLLLSRTYSDGSQATYTRDAAGQVTTATTPWWTTQVAYDAATGKVSSVERGGQKVEWTRDGFLVTEEKSSVSGVAVGTVAWTYDSDFRVTSLAVNGAGANYSYDADGLVTQAGSEALGRSATTGQLSSATLGVVRADYAYDAYGDLASSATTVSGASLFAEAFTRDALGRIQAKDETVQGVAVRWGYVYDSVGRLRQVTKGGVVVGSWTYDANGNRLSDGTTAAAYDVQDRQTSFGVVTFGHDANGNRATRAEGASVTRYSHDGMGGLQAVTLPDGTRLEYVLDGLQRRVAKKRNGVVERRWLYDGQTRVVAEVDAAGAVSRFVYGTFGHSPDYMVRGGVTYRFVHDCLGSVRLVVDSGTGAVVQRLDYDAWGSVLADSSPGFQPFAFAGGVRDLDTGLVHFGFRDYDSQVGRWTGKDPVRFAGGDSNLYAYVLGAPIGKVDPIGLWAFQFGFGGFGGLFGGAGASGGLAFDSEGNVGTYETAMAASGIFAALGTGFTVAINWDAPNISALGGVGHEAGAIILPVSAGWTGSVKSGCQAKAGIEEHNNGIFVSGGGKGGGLGLYFGFTGTETQRWINVKPGQPWFPQFK